jgi:2-(1,2-epoxy-1,2-dihydrophenyl)acetyl-CoA isomerase
MNHDYMLHEYKSLRLAIRDDGVAEVVFTEAERGNPIDLQFCQDLNALSVALSDDARVRAVLLRAEGKAFSVGGDLAFFNDNVDTLSRVILASTAQLNPAISRLQRMNAPIVGAIHGVCAGGMVALLAGSDILVTVPQARFISAYAGIGYSCDAGASVTVARRMGLARARRYLLMNETLDADTALATGLVDEVVAPDALLEYADGIARRLAAGPTLAHGQMRRLLLSAEHQDLETQLELESQSLAMLARGHDAPEGVRAFAGKRKPQFVGR